MQEDMAPEFYASCTPLAAARAVAIAGSSEGEARGSQARRAQSASSGASRMHSAERRCPARMHGSVAATALPSSEDEARFMDLTKSWENSM